MWGNYIKLNRSILNWEWWKDLNTYRLFTYMLLKANWKDSSYKGVYVPRGSFVSSLNKLSEETNLTVNEVRTALKHMNLTGEVTSKSHGKFTVFTVNNYCHYQDFNTENHTEITRKSQTIKRRKESNNIINNIYRARGNRFNAFVQQEDYDLDALEEQIISN